ncbi:MAG: hypothetical protein COV29_00405 [Candidatus Yanofskybacteria bacterium CG10_big_fil_rev_8_21_14_0_10_36_16]|uniref:SHS2 domain-containing protein n=1 Tax=Candidatus Yanofskybacteria bacterium CG10_big_fil_rev_8_21_14_0_10_36_16 TaxID=1975096 RepID=A0A2J0Q8P5_9BACT|nr:MAG: hypothetical protein COV29_00405 [Candidatus Yanofskybacteria bacterium CG10_big_fil_rev_8_21_14_0_10_36_16]
MGLFGFKPKTKLGIDIGTASIKVVELSEEKNRFKLNNYGIFELESGGALAVKHEAGKRQMTQLSDTDIVWGVKEILKKGKIRTKDAVASIPSFLTFATVVKIPFVPNKNIAQTINFEARKYIPLPLDEVVLDWSILSIDKSKEEKDKEKKKEEELNDKDKEKKKEDNKIKGGASLEVFLAAVPKEETARYQSVIKRAGLQLRALELENSALIRALIGNDQSPIAITNIGGRSTSILVVDKGIERVSHNYEVGGFEITKSIASSLNISIKRAEELKRSFGLRDEENNVINRAMGSLVDLMVIETSRTIKGYEEKNHTKIETVILVGGLTNMPSFVKYFSQKLDREVSVGNPMARITAPPGLEPLKQELNSTFAISLGLAMRKI